MGTGIIFDDLVNIATSYFRRIHHLCNMKPPWAPFSFHTHKGSNPDGRARGFQSITT